ncbi:tol-pal system-associated acyl-CoA thioesterase [Thorsellia kenyensis]|uniref:Tol-pal system-associated acyl-CoA thioesterase n=1 Tax=Thorsellia kenyensis TaxID=1549888 RepID=A0ABV6CDI8_9GAMM
MNLNKIYHWPIRVYYEDTDAGGVVYHARYVAFFERARTELLRTLGFSQQRLLQEDVAFAVRRMSIEFHRPAVLDDELEIETEITELNHASIIFEQRLFRKENQVLLSQANVVVASVSKTKMKAMRLPASIKNGVVL